MRSVRPGPIPALAVLSLLLVAGLSRLYDLQFSGGSGVGAGSTLRADLEGSMILYESLEKVDGISVTRNADPPHRAFEGLDPESTVYVMLNIHGGQLERNPELGDFVRQGGRVLIAPGLRKSWKEEDPTPEPEVEQEEPGEKDSKEKEPESEPLDVRIPGLREYGFQGPDTESHRVRRTAALTEGPDVLEWPVERVFDLKEDATSSYDILYTMNDHPVVMRSVHEAGEVLWLSDAYLLSNDAMYARRPTEWIRWVIGDANTVVFEESHFGMNRPKGLAALMWNFRLQGLVFGLGLPFLLLIWHGAVSLLPPLSPEQEIDINKQSRLSGFRDLLARHIPASDALKRCVREWEKTFLTREGERRRFEDLSHQAELILEDRDLRKPSHLSAGYQRLHNILTQKRTRM